MAWANDIHLLCLPAHTTHILQTLDMGVFKSFKSTYNKCCHRYLSDHPGCVITEEVIGSLISEAYVHSHSMLNVLSGFKKCGVYHLNPGKITDRQLGPSTAFHSPNSISTSSSQSGDSTPPSIASEVVSIDTNSDVASIDTNFEEVSVDTNSAEVVSADVILTVFLNISIKAMTILVFLTKKVIVLHQYLVPH